MTSKYIYWVAWRCRSKWFISISFFFFLINNLLVFHHKQHKLHKIFVVCLSLVPFQRTTRYHRFWFQCFASISAIPICCAETLTTNWTWIHFSSLFLFLSLSQTNGKQIFQIKKKFNTQKNVCFNKKIIF